MKSFTFPVIVVLGLSMVCGFITLASFNFADQARQNLSLTEEHLVIQKRQLKQMREGLTVMEATNDAVNRFLGDWRPDLAYGEEMVPTFNELNMIATSHQVSQGPRNQDNATAYTLKGKSFKVKRYLYAVSGDFTLLLHWLHDAEARFPLARFDAVTINHTGQSLEMQTALVFPRDFKMP